MELLYEMCKDGSVMNARFEGLDGCERVTSVKQALTLLKVKNPAVDFAKAAKEGMYDHMSDGEYDKILHAVKCISMLWRYEGDEPADKTTRPEMNVLMLLANAIEVISRQNAQLRSCQDLDLPF